MARHAHQPPNLSFFEWEFISAIGQADSAIIRRGRALGIPDLEFRQVRTTFASLYEGDEADRKSIMGHHSARFTLERYRKPVEDRRKKSVEDLDKRFRKVVEITKKAG